MHVRHCSMHLISLRKTKISSLLALSHTHQVLDVQLGSDVLPHISHDELRLALGSARAP